MLEDFRLCHDSSWVRDTNHTRIIVVGGNPVADVAGAVIGNAIGQAVVSAIRQHSTGERLAALCMRRHDYVAVPLTLDEQSAFQGQPTGEKPRWIDAFYARADFTERYAAVNPVPLPDAKADALAFGAVRLDPTTLSAAPGVVKPNEVVLSGGIAYRSTAKLASDVSVAINGEGRLPGGSVMHEAVFRGGDGLDHTYWCGPYELAGKTLKICIRNDPDGYFVAYSTGAHWIATGLDTPDGSATIATPIRLEEDGSDPSSALDFALVVRTISDTSAFLEADVTRDGESETIWKSELSFDAQGKAELPFWTYRLELSRADGGVIASFRPDGDGRGWPEMPPNR